MRSKFFPVVALLALAAAACELPFSTSTQQEENVLFQDDFSDVDSGWDRTSFDTGFTDYERNGYRIFVDETNYSAWANPSRNFTDVSVEVEAKKIGGDDDNEFGIICRHANVDNFYVATISSDGFYGFLIRKNGESLELLNMQNMLPSDAINLGNSSNHIRLDCVGSTLTLYVNGEFVGETVDTSIGSGDVGLYAGTFSVPGTDMLFDNFVVREP